MLSTTPSITDPDAAVTAARDQVQTARDQMQAARDLAGYGNFRRIIAGQFEEPPRPSRDDVEAVAGVVQAALESTGSQNVLEVTGTEVVQVEGFGGYAGGFRHHLAEGRTHRIRLSPGVIRRRSFDAAKAEKTAERIVEARKRTADDAATLILAGDDEGADGASRSEITKWSAKSRVNLTETVGSLSYANWPREHGDLAMVTLTLPDQWLILAPNGAAFKKLLKKFRRRFEYHSGLPWRLLWKLEFQGRGAPHWHALMRVPVFVRGQTFQDWLSKTWADVVGASKTVDGMDSHGNDDSEYLRHLRAGTRIDLSGKDFTDPRRISMYFLGHSAKSTDGKEYQHDVPEPWQKPGQGPGRFWGYVGLDKAVVELDVTEADRVLLDRQLRKIKRARDWKMNVLREQGNAVREGKPVPSIPDVMVPRRKKAGRAAHRTANRRARLAAHERLEGPIIGRDLLLIHGPLPKHAWKHQARSAYAPFSRGQGGFVLVNDALKLGLDLAAYLTSCRSDCGSWNGHVPPSAVGDFKDWGSTPYSLPSRVKYSRTGLAYSV